MQYATGVFLLAGVILFHGPLMRDGYNGGQYRAQNPHSCRTFFCFDRTPFFCTMANDASELKGKTGFKRLVNAFLYSWDGFKAAFSTEEAFRQETLLAAALAAVLPWLAVSVELKLLGLLALVFVLVTELLNSGLEAVVDRIGPEIHPLSKVAKDVGSCAVLFALTAAALVWGVILWKIVS